MRSIDLSRERIDGTWRRRLPGLLVSLLVLSLPLVGCGATTSHPTGGSDLVLRIDVGGGFVPVEYNLTQTPTFSLFGDGRVIVTGPMIEIWPQPAMPNLQQTIISQETMDKLLSEAKEAGLFANDVDYGIPGITDVATTTITVNADGKSYESSIYALGFGETFEQDLGGSASDLGLTPEQVEARSAVLEFTMKTGDLDSFAGTTLEWQPYDFTSLAVFSLAYDPTSPQYDETLPPNHLDWPLDDLATLGETVPPEGYRRVIVSGADLATLRPMLSEATKITLWKSGEREYYLYFRPLLPDENA